MIRKIFIVKWFTSLPQNPSLEELPCCRFQAQKTQSHPYILKEKKKQFVRKSPDRLKTVINKQKFHFHYLRYGIKL